MTIRGKAVTEVIAQLDRSDVYAMLEKAGMKPEGFGKFWGAEIKATGDGGIQITYTQELNIEPAPKLK